MNVLFLKKAKGVLARKADATIGRLYPLQRTLTAMEARPFELHLELTNLCNADCVFCPYHFQESNIQFMSDEVFYKAVSDYVACGGGGVGLTPIVGDALIDPKFVDRVKYLRSIPTIDRIWVTTNAILLDKHGVNEVLDSGLTSITISTAGFEEAMYERVYRNKAYHRMRRNVLALVEQNNARKRPLAITIGLRPDRPLQEVMRDQDFQPILKFGPKLDFTWSFTSAGGRINREMLPETMKLRHVSVRREPCVELYNGPIVLADGRVEGCSCVASMDAFSDLGIGNVLSASLIDIWRGEELKKQRAAFGTNELNKTCAGCDMYRNLDLYRTREGRQRSRINLARGRGKIVKRESSSSSFGGG